jgi:hypothetical protein
MRTIITSVAAVVLSLTAACLANAQTSNGGLYRPQMPAAQVPAPLRNMNVTTGPTYVVPPYAPAAYPAPVAPAYPNVVPPAAYPTTPAYITPGYPAPQQTTVVNQRTRVTVRVPVIKR